MRAVLKDDIIINIIPKGETEIGKLPKAVGLERLRFDGEKIIDLAELNTFWVVAKSSTFFELHCIEVPNSQQISMIYSERKRLYLDNGIIRLRAEQEYLDFLIQKDTIVQENKTLKDNVITFAQNVTDDKIDAYLQNVFTYSTQQERDLKLAGLLKKIIKVLTFIIRKHIR